MIHRNPSFGHRQRGAVLVVSLLLLLVMTVLALGASQATRMQERMAGNSRDRDLAFQSVEGGVRAGERRILKPTNPGSGTALIGCMTAKMASSCDIYDPKLLGGTPYTTQAFESKSWWDTNTWDYAAAKTMSGQGLVSADPHYYIEDVEEVPDSLTIPPIGPQPGRVYYRVTAHGVGGTDSAQVMLQTTFSRRTQ
jgi:type IV pilus assembly protein PilX